MREAFAPESNNSSNNTYPRPKHATRKASATLPRVLWSSVHTEASQPAASTRMGRARRDAKVIPRRVPQPV